MGYALEGNRDAHRLTFSNAWKYLRYLESKANAATVTTKMESAAKANFASAMAQAGAGPEDYALHLTDFMARANGAKRYSLFAIPASLRMPLAV